MILFKKSLGYFILIHFNLPLLGRFNNSKILKICEASGFDLYYF